MVAVRAPVQDTNLVLPSFVLESGGECAAISPSGRAVDPLATSSSIESADWPKDLIGEIKRVLGAPNVKPCAPSFHFQMDKESAERNFIFLERHDLDLSKALRAQKGSPLDYGSEFKPVEVLERLFGRHPNWERMKKILTSRFKTLGSGRRHRLWKSQRSNKE